MSIKTFAAIDVGSFELTMKIYEFSGKNSIKEVDTISKPLDLGSDTYANGKISNEKIDELCKSLIAFKDIMKAYKVDDYRAYGTSAIRETKNTAIVQNLIAERTGIFIKVLSNSEQRFLDYKSVASKGESFRKIIEEKTAIVDIGGGSIQCSLFDKDTLVSTQNLRLGVLRIQEKMHHLNPGRAQLELLVDEMITAQLSIYKKLYLKDRVIQNLIVIDDYISPWALKRVGKNSVTIESADIEHLMDILENNNRTDAAIALGVAEEKIPLVLISALLLTRIIKLTGATQVWAPGVTLCDGMAYEYAEEINMFKGEHDFEKDIIACAMNISKRYMGSRKRAETLEKITTTIFDSMKRIHGMGKRERLYLQIAVMLHDCGKYISMINIGETSYDIIMATEIIGLSHEEREIVASVVRYNHSNFGYFEGAKGGNLSDMQHYMTVAKLTAILRLANSLDRSHKQKLKDMQAVLRDQELILNVQTQADVTLEKGYFDMNASFFKEIFGIEPVLKTKKNF